MRQEKVSEVSPFSLWSGKEDCVRRLVSSVYGVDRLSGEP